jgi:pyruvate kinase
MRRQRNAKIIATLGPASGSPDRIEALFEAGVDVFRVNLSHGSYSEHAARIASIRSLEERSGRPIGILMDLQGPKLRIGEFVDGRVELQKGDKFSLDLSPEAGTVERVTLPHPEIFAALVPGSHLLLDDGKMRLEVLSCGPAFAETKVITGGTLSDHKGVNVPNVVLPLSALTEKDRRDLDFGLSQGVDWVGLSFVQRPEDVAELRDLVHGRAGILAKLEKPLAVEPKTLARIVAKADAIMVARGDLGVECPPEDVPALQKQIIAACRMAGKPVVVATQMLESMIHSPTPTRAEASDVATAIYDGADAVMLSAETAVGEYPLEAVEMMNRIVRRVEQDPLYRKIRDADHPAPEATVADAIGAAVRQVTHTVSAKAIVTFTASGSTAFRIARERPEVPILGMTVKTETSRRLNLVWGVHSVHIDEDIHNVAEMVSAACHWAKEEEFADNGDWLAIVAGVPFGIAGSTNILHVVKVGESGGKKR